MKTTKKILLFAVSVLVLSSCSQPLTEGASPVMHDSTPRGVATEYIRNMNVWANLSNGRSATDNTMCMDFLNDYDMQDEDGNAIDFASLDYDAKKRIFEEYQKQEIDYATEVLENDEELLEIIKLDNEAMGQMIQEAGRSVLVDNSPVLFLSRYMEKRRQLLEKAAAEEETLVSRSSSSSSSSETTVELHADDLNPDSVRKFKEAYKKGRVLLCRDCSSVTSSGWGLYVGHAAMMSEDSWNPKWEEDGLSRTTISAWANDGKSVSWEGKIDGVQKEPLAYWAGKSEGSAQHVKILQMRKKTVKIRWLWIIPYIWFDFSSTAGDADVAVRYAESNIGKPYRLWVEIADFFVGGILQTKWWTDKFYCSQLVWRSWVEANGNYDFSQCMPLIFPEHFEMTSSATFITEYNNY